MKHVLTLDYSEIKYIRICYAVSTGVRLMLHKSRTCMDLHLMIKDLYNLLEQILIT